ncbi:hypothetical protein GCM10010915_22780 [Microbacterium faecale]|uniref:Uncharacterized protein n=1 Tax=Microbacterium faecale TaxID=1804630 RepID=A0A917DIJ1_9MICO|nr:hypothetical protein [Microbacterium faecale]GGD41281.1 hypothetical protein GCM10010915_22780 [Microbacterium faecale]
MKDDVLLIGRAVPGALIRAASAGVSIAGVWLVGAPLFWIAVAAVAAVVGAIVPRTMFAWIALAALPVALTLQSPDLGHTCVAVAALHLGHVLATLSGVVSLRSRVALRALIPTARRVLIVQVVAQAAALFAFAIPAADGRGAAWIAPVGALAVAATAVMLVRGISQKKHGRR